MSIAIEPPTWEFFEFSEFACPCTACRPLQRNEMLHKTIGHLHAARETSQVRWDISSGWRCEDHNRQVGGSENSAHLTGHAADILTPNSYYRYRILSALVQHGFRRIGVYNDFIHADDSPWLPQNVIWHGD